MLNQILPQRLDNSYDGHVLGLWLFTSILIVKIGIALATILNGRDAAVSADGIPIDSFGVAGAQAVLALFALWGLSQLVISVFGVLALVRYRAMIPLMFALFVLEHLARRWILVIKPIARTGTAPGSYINIALLGLMIVGTALSLRWTAPPEKDVAGT